MDLTGLKVIWYRDAYESQTEIIFYIAYRDGEISDISSVYPNAPAYVEPTKHPNNVTNNRLKEVPFLVNIYYVIP